MTYLDSETQIKILKNVSGVESFEERLKRSNLYPLRSSSIEILQMNITRRCNFSCKHCHVQAGADRTEEMSKELLDICAGIIDQGNIPVVDITGGAPEMNQHLEYFLRNVAPLNRRLIVRSNLAILLDPSYAHFSEVYAELGIELFTSLPDYGADRTDRQRNNGAFSMIIESMKRLNGLGYGKEGTGLILNIVHNPVGAYLPAQQAALEHEYRRRLSGEDGVQFSSLVCLTNCPVGRYLEYLIRTENLESYLQQLQGAYNPVAAANMMCRTTLSVGWDGMLFDCDFNQMLDMPVNHGAPDHVKRFDLNALKTREIMVNNHCYCCAAGSGSSCQGATVD